MRKPWRLPAELARDFGQLFPRRRLSEFSLRTLTRQYKLTLDEVCCKQDAKARIETYVECKSDYGKLEIVDTWLVRSFPGGAYSGPWRAQDSVERLAAMFVAITLGNYRRRLTYLRNYLVAAPILLLLAAASYPFEPQSTLLIGAGSLAVLATVLLLVITRGLSHDEITSRIGKTTPGQFSLNPDSILTLMLSVLPLMYVVLSFLPGGSVLSSWINPLLRALSLH